LLYKSSLPIQFSPWLYFYPGADLNAWLADQGTQLITPEINFTLAEAA